MRKEREPATRDGFVFKPGTEPRKSWALLPSRMAEEREKPCEIEQIRVFGVL